MAGPHLDGHNAGDNIGECLGSGKNLPGRDINVRQAAEHRRVRTLAAVHMTNLRVGLYSHQKSDFGLMR